MTLDEVKAVVERIRDGNPGPDFLDHEDLHALEDQLHGDVIRAIADGAEDAAALAREALKTTELKFSRWYA